MNASLNAIVSGISTKIKEQEEQRVAQDKENLTLRTELQVLEAFVPWICLLCGFHFGDQRAEQEAVVGF